MVAKQQSNRYSLFPNDNKYNLDLKRLPQIQLSSAPHNASQRNRQRKVICSCAGTWLDK